jgi:hypothetical protein
MEDRLYWTWGAALADYYLGDYKSSVEHFKNSQNARRQLHKSYQHGKILSAIKNEKKTVHGKIIKQQQENSDIFLQSYSLALYQYGRELVRGKQWNRAIIQFVSLKTKSNDLSDFDDLENLLNSCYFNATLVDINNKEFESAHTHLHRIPSDAKLPADVSSLADTLNAEWGDYSVHGAKWLTALEKYNNILIHSTLYPRARAGVAVAEYKLGLIEYNSNRYQAALDRFQSAANAIPLARHSHSTATLLSEDDLASYLDSSKSKIRDQRYSAAVKSGDHSEISQFIKEYPGEILTKKILPHYHAALYKASKVSFSNGEWQRTLDLIRLIPVDSKMYDNAQASKQAAEENLFTELVKTKGISSLAEGRRFVGGYWHTQKIVGSITIYERYLFRDDGTFSSWISQNPANWNQADRIGSYSIVNSNITRDDGGFAVNLRFAEDGDEVDLEFLFQKEKLEMLDQYGDTEGFLEKQ